MRPGFGDRGGYGPRPLPGMLEDGWMVKEKKSEKRMKRDGIEKLNAPTESKPH